MSAWGGRRAQALLAVVLDAYGTSCCHCHKPIVFGLRPRHRLGPSVEHVLPRSLGGSDDLANLRPAHLGCNARRGNRITTTGAGARPAETGGRFFSAGPLDTPPAISIPPR